MRADAVQQLRDVHGPDRVLELLPGLFRLPIPLPRNPLRELNAYLIRGRERSLLIDTGFREPACRQALQAGLRAAGAEHDPLDVLLTHIHTDHTGLASEVVRPGGAIYIGRGDYPFTSRAWEEEYWGRIDQRFLQEGFPPEELRITTGTNPARTLGPDLDLPNYQPLEDGDRLTVGEYTLEVIAAPGHTPGQICLWMADQQVLFTADHVLFDITPNITMWPNLPNALGRYLESLTRIGTYPARLALPGHRHTADLAPRIQALLAHHRRRAAETLAIVRREGGLNAYQVASRMTWDIRADSWADFPLNQKWFATGEALAHLEYLVEEGAGTRRAGPLRRKERVWGLMTPFTVNGRKLFGIVSDVVSVVVVLQSGLDRLLRQYGAVEFMGGQSVQGLRHRLVGEVHHLIQGLALNHLRGHGTGGNGAAAAKGFKLHVRDRVLVNFQVDFHNIAAFGVADLAHAVWVFQDAHVAGVAEMVHDLLTV